MINSHRTPSTLLITLGGALFVLSFLLPGIFSPGTPHGVLVAALVLRSAGPLVLTCGACIYARGIGYPAWLGIFSLTLVGLVMLMFLPDRCPSPEDEDEF